MWRNFICECLTHCSILAPNQANIVPEIFNQSWRRDELSGERVPSSLRDLVLLLPLSQESRDRRLLHRGGILGVNLGGAKMNLSFVNCKTQDFLNHQDRSALGVQLWRNKGSLLWSIWQSLANLCRCRSPLGHYLPYTPFGRPVG